MVTPGTRRGRTRRGSLTLELLFVLPILLALLLATVEFSLIALTRQQLLSASREGARVAAGGGDAAETEHVVRQVLGGGRLAAAKVEVTGTDAGPGEPVAVWVRLPTGQAVPDLLGFFGYSINGEVIVTRTVMRKE